MAVFGIIAEYNPFHNGHLYQIETVKKNKEDRVIVVMSPNVVQRGDFALFSKWTRTQAALKCGADLVLELPSFYALSTAEKFAYGSVKILDSLGSIDRLSFGSECGNIELLNKTAELIISEDVVLRTKEIMKDGTTYAKARMQAIGEKSKECAEIISNPNDILAVEYIRNLRKLNSNIIPSPILRKCVEHESFETNENFASASYLRQNIDKLSDYVPQKAFEIYKEKIVSGAVSKGINSLSDALILKLRMENAEKLNSLPDISEGIENRILREAKNAETVAELIENVKTKRYTMSRIRRLMMYALLDFPKDIAEIPYIRVLGSNENGRKLLSNSKLPIVTSLARAREISENARFFAETEEKCTSAFSMTLENKNSAENEFSTQCIFIK